MLNHILYLAIPYSGQEAYSYEVSCKAAYHYMKQGYCVFSPITHSHPLVKIAGAPQNDHDFWLKQDLTFLELADILCVVKLPNWEKSYGVNEEIKLAKKLGIPIMYVSLVEVGI